MKKDFGFQLGEYLNYCYQFLESFEKMEDIENLDSYQINYLSQIFGLVDK